MIGLIIPIVVAVILVFLFLRTKEQSTNGQSGYVLLVVLGVALIAVGLHRHLSGDDSLHGGGRFGPQGWYQEVGIGVILLAIALGGTSQKK